MDKIVAFKGELDKMERDQKLHRISFNMISVQINNNFFLKSVENMKLRSCCECEIEPNV